MPEQDYLSIFPAGQTVSAVDYFFNPERGGVYFLHYVWVDEMVFIHKERLLPSPISLALIMTDCIYSPSWLKIHL